MTRLSVNINKIATLRNARGGNIPNLIKVAIDCESFGANGITVHPRPDERHIKYQDVRELSTVVKEEFNIEGFPNNKFIELIEEVRPNQVTLVPDPPDAITSNSGWDTITNYEFLEKVITKLKSLEVRISLFMDPNLDFIKSAKELGVHRIELYTEPYASKYPINRAEAIDNYIKAAKYAESLGLELNAGHDLNLENLEYFASNIPSLKEVSIGHALISDALYFGLENTIQMYLRKLRIQNEA